MLDSQNPNLYSGTPPISISISMSLRHHDHHHHHHHQEETTMTTLHVPHSFDQWMIPQETPSQPYETVTAHHQHPHHHEKKMHPDAIS